MASNALSSRRHSLHGPPICTKAPPPLAPPPGFTTCPFATLWIRGWVRHKRPSPPPLLCYHALDKELPRDGTNNWCQLVWTDAGHTLTVRVAYNCTAKTVQPTIWVTATGWPSASQYFQLTNYPATQMWEVKPALGYPTWIDGCELWVRNYA